MEITNNNIPSTAEDFQSVMDAADALDAAVVELTDPVSEDEKPGSELRCDKAAAEKYLKRLDPNATGCTFQIFDDNKKRKDNKLAKIVHGTIDERWDELVAHNKRGAGIFVTVNETDGTGRKKENIVRVRGYLFVDDDNGKLDVASLPLKPHITVSTSPGGKKHCYWRVDGLELDEFTALQKLPIAALGTDSAIHNIDRVMRIPGYYHNKGAPYLVTAEYSDHPAYSVDEIKKAFHAKENNAQHADLLHGHNSDLGAGLYKDKSFELARTSSALEHIPHKDGYDYWLRIGMALYNSSGGFDGAKRLWHEWSKGYGEGYCAEELESKWNSFVDEARSEAEKLTVATMFKIARDNGWTGEYKQDDETHKLAKEDRRALLDNFNALHAVVNVEGGTYIVSRYIDSRSQVKSEFRSKIAASDYYANKYIPKIDKKPTSTTTGVLIAEREKLFPVWFNSEQRKQYTQVVFEPRGGLVQSIGLPLGHTYNLYTGLALEPLKGQRADYSLILQHILIVWCKNDRYAFKYTLKWFARMVQQPGKQGSTVLVLRSGEGAGKNIIVDMFLRFFGNAGIQLTSSADVTGRFNDYLGTSVFIHMNEAVWGGSHEAQGRLKSLITDDHLTVERKFVNKFMVNNCSHIIVSSNSDWTCPVGVDDRRYAYYQLEETHKGDRKYFSPLATQTQGKGQQVFLHFLLNLNIAGFSPADMPAALTKHSSGRLDNKLRSADSVTRWWYEVLHDEGATDVVVGSELMLGWDKQAVAVGVDDLRKHYKEWCTRKRVHHEDGAAFGRKVKKMVGIWFTKKRTRHSDGSRAHKYTLPILSDCRDAFEDYIDQKVDWKC